MERDVRALKAGHDSLVQWCRRTLDHGYKAVEIALTKHGRIGWLGRLFCRLRIHPEIGVTHDKLSPLLMIEPDGTDEQPVDWVSFRASCSYYVCAACGRFRVVVTTEARGDERARLTNWLRLLAKDVE